MTNVKANAKNHSRGEVYEANKSHKAQDRKVKGLRPPKNAPYRKPKYRVTAYDYYGDEEVEY